MVEHRAKPGATMESMRSTAYALRTTPKKLRIRRMASEVNANPRDTADHPNGAWSLPPFFRSGDKEKYSAIGESDRMTLKFRKPG